MFASSLILLATSLLSGPAAAAPPIPLDGFADGISHWQKKFGRDHDLATYGPEDYRGIADNLLAWQNPDGGWPKDVDWRVKLPKAELEALMQAPRSPRSTFDNHNTVPQVAYLSEAYRRSEDTRYRDGARAALAYILREQRTSGGWQGSDVDAITFNDGTMVGIMELLRDMKDGALPYAWLTEEERNATRTALDAAIACTLRCQIVSKGVKTAWCQQHDHETFLPVKARSYELASITALESVGVVQFLMELDAPTPEITEAIEAAVAWFRAAAIPGIRLEYHDIEPVRYENHTATRDVTVVQDPSAPPLWARYYDLETGKPFFCNRDGIVVQTLAEVALERRTGYAWYGAWPAQLLEVEYPQWKAGLNPAS